MRDLLPLRPPACVAGVASVLALAAACGSSGNPAQTGSSTSGGTTGSGGATTSTTTSTGGQGGCIVGDGGKASYALTLPQFVHGAAYVDTLGFPQVPIVVSANGPVPSGVAVTVDGKDVPAVPDGTASFVATLGATLAPGPHMVQAVATGCNAQGSAMGTLVAGAGSLQLTDFSMAGPAYSGHLWHDVAGDALAFSWIDVRTGKHALYYNQLDGAFARLGTNDIVLNDPADEPLSGYTAPGAGGLGVVYRTAKPGDSHWLVKMRVVDTAGKELVPAMDLTAGQAAFSMAQAGADPGGFSAAWLHISPPMGTTSPPVEIRFARWDLAAKKLVGPITLDSDQPQAMGSSEGPQSLEPLAEIGIACNTKICLVSYTRDVYNALVQLNIPKLFLATVDLATGQLAGKPVAVEASDWDTQMWGHHLVALDDGSFVLVYTANDTVAAVSPKSPCDNMIERDLLFALAIDAAGNKKGAPKAIFDQQGSRQYPRVAPHPAGFALFWEDQRSECALGGHIRMTANVTPSTFSGLLDPYLEIPGSIGLPPEDPSLAVAGTNALTAWSDDRHGMGLIDPRPEIYLDTYWRK